MNRATVAQGIHGSGSRDYSESQASAVIGALLRATGEVTVEELARLTGVPGRAVRQIVSDHDGQRYLLGGSGNGYRCAESQDDAEQLTARLVSQAEKMWKRVARRREYAGRLPRIQQGLGL